MNEAPLSVVRPVSFHTVLRIGRLGVFGAAVGSLLLPGNLAAQTPDKVEFATDILPLLRENCTECHGKAKQKGGMRLDRKSSAMKAFSRRIMPGSSANSMVYQRLVGSEYGNQMPPTGELRPEKIALIKAWIDQGANWPDSLSNESELPPPDVKALALVDMLQKGDLVGFVKMAEAEPALLNARGPEGSTPFMYAALYVDAATIEK